VTALARDPSGALGSTAFRLAAAGVALFVLAAAAIVGVLFWQTNKVLTEQVLATLGAEADVLSEEARRGGLGRLEEALAARSRPDGPGLYFLSGGDGAKLAGNLNRLPPELQASPEGGVFRYARSGVPDAGERLGVGIPIALPGGATLVIGRDVEEQRAFADRVGRIFLLGFGALALAGLAGGLAISRRILGRIETINAASRTIMAGDLSRRVPVDGSNDELDGLAQSLNAMLDRIEQLMNGLREVSDNIAHDLKTPLSRLRNRAEAALRDPRREPAYREGLERTLEEADELIKTFNALLLIARLEAGALEEATERFDLGALVRDVAELYEPVAEEAGLSLALRAGAGPWICANRQLVGQAVANLIDNAIKYGARPSAESLAPSPPRVEVGVYETGAGIEIAVADSGPGVATSDRERVLKRFVRLEESRTRPGTGLGLSLVAAVARLHRGCIRLEDNVPGLRAVLVLPNGLAAPAEGDR
jgi:signal transduction histidine kinase